MSSTSVMRATTLSAPFVRSPTMWIRPNRPGSLCGACLNICTTCCGTLIGIPAAIMQGILAPPPPPRYRPPSGCGPTMCPPPMCGPPQCAPRPITKCKPVSYRPNPMPYGYAPAAAGPSPFIVPASFTTSCFILHGAACRAKWAIKYGEPTSSDTIQTGLRNTDCARIAVGARSFCRSPDRLQRSNIRQLLVIRRVVPGTARKKQFFEETQFLLIHRGR